jgi:hypothetical protein
MNLDFKEISGLVHIRDVLNLLNIPFTEDEKEIKTEDIIANKEKNMFFYKKTKKGGSVIQFYADHSGKTAREAAAELFRHFLSQPPRRKREIPELKLQHCEFLKKQGLGEEFCKQMNIGLCKQKSIFNGFVCVKTSEHYIGYKEKDNKWLFPKGFTRDFLYDPLKINSPYAICTADVFDCLYLIANGFNYAVSILGKSATDKQVEILSKFKRILLIHPAPHNIANRLMANSFVKINQNSVIGLSKEEIKALF